MQGGDLYSRLEEAERALALKQDLIDKLKEEVEQQKGSLETIPVLTAQVKTHSLRYRTQVAHLTWQVQRCKISVPVNFWVYVIHIYGLFGR